jgi:hypothetical protein
LLERLDITASSKTSPNCLQKCCHCSSMQPKFFARDSSLILFCPGQRSGGSGNAPFHSNALQRGASVMGVPMPLQTLGGSSSREKQQYLRSNSRASQEREKLTPSSSVAASHLVRVMVTSSKHCESYTISICLQTAAILCPARLRRSSR